jgi:hypothetical protein
MKVPAAVTTGIICLMLGLGAGALTIFYVGGVKLPTWLPAWLGGEPEPDFFGVVPKGPPIGISGPKGKGGGKGGNAAGPRPPSAKAQLNDLVAKLDVLTRKPLTVTLDAEQKKQVAESLKELDTMEDLSEETAKERLDSLLEALKDHRETLEFAGVRWPGSVRGQPGLTPTNPFKVEPGEQHLQSLNERVKGPTS